MKFVVPISLGWYLFFCFIVLLISVKIFFIFGVIGVIYILIFRTKLLLQVLWYLFLMGLPGMAIKYWPISIGLGILSLLAYFLSKEKAETKELPMNNISVNSERDDIQAPPEKTAPMG